VTLGYVVAGPAAAAIGTGAVFTVSAAWVLGSTSIIVLVPAVRDVRATPVADYGRPL
jgi:hypothetical protein